MLACVIITREHANEFFTRYDRYNGHNNRVTRPFHLVFLKRDAEFVRSSHLVHPKPDVSCDDDNKEPPHNERCPPGDAVSAESERTCDVQFMPTVIRQRISRIREHRIQLHRQERECPQCYPARPVVQPPCNHRLRLRTSAMSCGLSGPNVGLRIG